jgi:DNA-binding PadR family transcriptional regulator
MGDDIEATQPLTPAVFHILLALSDGPLHGYAVMKRVEADAGVAMGPGTVYGALQRLVDAGWVEKTPGPSLAARRGRIFALTPKGRHALRGEAARLSRLSRLVEERTLAVDEGS